MMRSHAGILLYYRALNGYRGLRMRHAGAWGAIRIAANLAAPPLLLYMIRGAYRGTASGMPSGTAAVPGAAFMLALASAFAVLVITFFEVFREIAFAADREHAAVLPISETTGLLYRLGVVSGRVLPYVLVFALAPIGLVGSALSGRMMALLLPTSVVLLASLVLVGLVLAVALLAACRLCRVSPQGVFSILYGSFGVGTILLAWSFGPKRWRALLAAPPWTPSLAEILTAAASSALLGAAALGAAVRLWPVASAPSERARTGELAAAILPVASFSRHWSRAVLQKDLRDLVRNPVHRYALAGLLVLVPLGLWASARRASQGGLSTYALMMLALNLLALAPLLFSARTVASERSMLDFYRLVLPRVGDLLTLKLQAQAVLNSILALAAAVPLFLLSRNTTWFAAGWFFGSTIVFVPVLTALALAVGTFFPERHAAPSSIGIRLRGAVVYFAIALPLYGFLLEVYREEITGSLEPLMLGLAVVCALVVAALSSVLFLAARRRLEEGWRTP